jgi:hypothetical protein
MLRQSSVCVMCFFGIANSITGTHLNRLRKTSTSSSSYRVSAGSFPATISQNVQ